MKPRCCRFYIYSKLLFLFFIFLKSRTFAAPSPPKEHTDYIHSQQINNTPLRRMNVLAPSQTVEFPVYLYDFTDYIKRTDGVFESELSFIVKVITGETSRLPTQILLPIILPNDYPDKDNREVIKLLEKYQKIIKDKKIPIYSTWTGTRIQGHASVFTWSPNKKDAFEFKIAKSRSHQSGVLISEYYNLMQEMGKMTAYYQNEYELIYFSTDGLSLLITKRETLPTFKDQKVKNYNRRALHALLGDTELLEKLTHKSGHKKVSDWILLEYIPKLARAIAENNLTLGIFGGQHSQNLQVIFDIERGTINNFIFKDFTGATLNHLTVLSNLTDKFTRTLDFQRHAPLLRENNILNVYYTEDYRIILSADHHFLSYEWQNMSFKHALLTPQSFKLMYLQYLKYYYQYAKDNIEFTSEELKELYRKIKKIYNLVSATPPTKRQKIVHIVSKGILFINESAEKVHHRHLLVNKIEFPFTKNMNFDKLKYQKFLRHVFEKALFKRQIYLTKTIYKSGSPVIKTSDIMNSLDQYVKEGANYLFDGKGIALISKHGDLIGYTTTLDSSVQSEIIEHMEKNLIRSCRSLFIGL